jgi:integrase
MTFRDVEEAAPAERRAAWVDRIRPARKRRELPDRGNGSVAGLYLIVQPSGRKSWAVRFRLHGKGHKFTLGGYPAISLADARAQAGETLGLVHRRINPATALRQEDDAPDLEAVAREFITRYCRKNRTWTETARLLGLKRSGDDLVVTEGGLVDRWGKRRLADIRRDEIIAVLDDIVDRGAPYVANRTFAYLRKLFNWALPRYRLAENPCRGVQPPGEEKSRDRVLSDEELKAVWLAAGKLGWPFGPVVKLLVLTGARREEVGAMEWSELDFERKLWTLPPERTKNKQRHEVPLSAAALEIIAGLKRGKGRFVFSTTHGRTSVTGYDSAKPRLDKLSGVKAWRLHDIRRTVASGMASLKIALPVIEKCINHTSGSFRGIVGVYQRHTFASEKREAFDAWATHVERIVNPPEDNVVPLRATQVTGGVA